MKTLHAKSPCCQGKIYYFGNKRRQCSLCKKTWRIRQKKRGIKPLRTDKRLLFNTFIENHTLKQESKRKGCKINTLHKRFRRMLKRVIQKSNADTYPDGELILIVDGLWYRFKRKDWVLYLRALRSTKQTSATFLDPLLLSGKETAENWRQSINTIPPKVKRRIKAFVSDDFRGSTTIAKNNKWIHQLCHFHLFARLQVRRGRRKKLSGMNIREAIYQTIRKLIKEPKEKQIQIFTRRLKRLSQHHQCPKKMQMIVNECLRRLDNFRAYLIYPKLNLPTTINCIESTAKRIRGKTRALRTPKSVQIWATAFIRMNPNIICNGKNFQPN